MRAAPRRLVVAARRAVMAAVACLALVPGLGSAAGWDVRSIAAEGNAEAKFPWVVGPSAAAADRINTLLFLDVLEIAPPRGSPSSYALPKPAGALVPVTPDGFTVLRRDDRVLSIAVSAEGCGAYCESFEKAFLFDLASGRRVTDADLLTPAGRAAIARRGAQAFAVAIGAEVAALSKPHARDLPDGDRDLLRSTYVECRDRQREAAKAGRLGGTLRIVASGAEVVFGRCTPHVIRALDDLGDFTYRVSAAELATGLSAYGRALLLAQVETSAPVSPFGQALPGTIGSAAVRLYTGSILDDGSLGGTYYYERYRRPIEVSGRIAEGVWSLTESDDEGKPRAAWSLRREGSAWTGTWTGVDGRRLPVRIDAGP